MVKNDIDTRIEEIASNAEGVACILGILGEDASRYSNHLGNSAYLMQTVCRQISEELYKIFDELRGGVNGKTGITNVAYVSSQEKISLRTSCYASSGKN